MNLSNTNITEPMPFTMPAKFGRGQFDHLNRFIVVNAGTGVAIEGYFNESKAGQACSNLMEHERTNGRDTVYEARPLPVRLHNLPPSQWK